jgi:hyperosmotically inducible periplasmic protein
MLLGVSFSLAGAALCAQHPAAAKQAKSESRPDESVLAREIRHQLLVLPFYSVFDYLAFSLDADKVTITGQVVRPSLRADAEAAIKSIEGVASVNNQIEVLPKSPADDDARRAVYRAIFEDSTLQRYAIPDVPTIHIVLKNGGVTLEGTVASEMEKALATTRAAKVAGISSVKNNLVVRPKSGPTN